jgi:hypothetical protein
MDETGRARGCLRTEEGAQLLEVNRLGDVKKVQNAEVAARNFRGSAAQKFWFRRRCDGHPYTTSYSTLDARTNARGLRRKTEWRLAARHLTARDAGVDHAVGMRAYSACSPSKGPEFLGPPKNTVPASLPFGLALSHCVTPGRHEFGVGVAFSGALRHD